MPDSIHIAILIVEDETHSQELLSLYLRGKGHRVFCASNVPEAVAIAKSEKLDLVFLDIVLPEISGFEAINEIRRFSPARIVLMTGYVNQDISEDARILGVQTVLQKPIDPSTLDRVLQETTCRQS